MANGREGFVSIEEVDRRYFPRAHREKARRSRSAEEDADRMARRSLRRIESSLDSAPAADSW